MKRYRNDLFFCTQRSLYIAPDSIEDAEAGGGAGAVRAGGLRCPVEQDHRRRVGLKVRMKVCIRWMVSPIKTSIENMKDNLRSVCRLL